MTSENDTQLLADTRFAVDLRHQFEELAAGRSHSREVRGVRAVALPKRRFLLVAVGVVAAAVAVALVLLFAHPGSTPPRQLALASPSPATHEPSVPSPFRKPPDIPDVTMVAGITVDASGRPWLSGVRGKDRQPFVTYLDGDQWVQVTMPAAELSLGPVAVLSTDDLWASVQRGFVHWDGTTWQKTNVPLLDGDTVWIEEMAVVSSSDIWAVGPQKGERYKTPGDGPGGPS